MILTFFRGCVGGVNVIFGMTFAFFLLDDELLFLTNLMNLSSI